MSDLLWMINKIRYIRPIESFLDIKAFILSLAFFSTALDAVIGLFTTDWELVFILGVVLIIDSITGMIAAKRRKNPLNSLGLRQMIIKVIEYSVFAFIMVMIANGFEKYALDEDIAFFLQKTAGFIKDVDVFAFMTLIWIEVVSIVENLTDKKGSIKRLLNEITKKIKIEKDSE